LVAVAAAAFITALLASGVTHTPEGEEVGVLIVGEQFSGLLIGGIVLMFVAIIFASNAARLILMGIGVRNPGTTMRGPLALTLGGALIGTIITIPGVLSAVLLGVIWGFIRVYDEHGDRGISTLTAIADNQRGDLSDFV